MIKEYDIEYQIFWFIIQQSYFVNELRVELRAAFLFLKNGMNKHDSSFTPNKKCMSMALNSCIVHLDVLVIFHDFFRVICQILWLRWKHVDTRNIFMFNQWFP